MVCEKNNTKHVRGKGDLQRGAASRRRSLGDTADNTLRDTARDGGGGAGRLSLHTDGGGEDCERSELSGGEHLVQVVICLPLNLRRVSWDYESRVVKKRQPREDGKRRGRRGTDACVGFILVKSGGTVNGSCSETWESEPLWAKIMT